MALALCGWLAFAKSGAEHIKDALGIMMDSSSDENARELMSYISQGMDFGTKDGGLDLAERGSSFWKTIRSDLIVGDVKDLKDLGEHHFFGHWDLSGSIPKEMLERVREKLGPEAEELFKLRWQEFVKSRTEAVKQVFGLTAEGADRYAQAFATMVDDIHNLGDYAADKSVKGLRSVDQITENYLRAANRMLGKNNNLTKIIKEEIAKLPKSLTDQERARAILKILDSHSAELSGRIFRIFERFGFDGTLKKIDYSKISKALLSFREKSAKLLTEYFKRHGNWLKQAAKAREFVVGGVKRIAYDIKVVKCNGKLMPLCEFVAKYASEYKALLQDAGKKLAKSAVVKGSKEIAEWLGTSAGQGVCSGVITFIVDEYGTVVLYRQGEMAQDTFWQKTAFNAGVAVVDGCVVYLVAEACAAVGAPVLVSIGAMVVAGVAVEKGGKLVWEKIEREVGVLPGIGIDELMWAAPDWMENSPTLFDESSVGEMKGTNRAFEVNLFPEQINRNTTDRQLQKKHMEIHLIENGEECEPWKLKRVNF